MNIRNSFSNKSTIVPKNFVTIFDPSDKMDATQISPSQANGQRNASRIVALADIIQKSVAELQSVLDSQNLPSPSFDEDSSPDALPSAAQKAQDAVLDATAELHDILLEPTALVLKTISVSSQI